MLFRETSRRSLLEAISKSSKVSEHDSAPNDSSFGFENQEDSPKKPTPPHVANGSSYNSSGGNVTDSTEHTAILTSGVKLLTRKSIREPSVVSSGPSAVSSLKMFVAWDILAAKLSNIAWKYSFFKNSVYVIISYNMLIVFDFHRFLLKC